MATHGNQLRVNVLLKPEQKPQLDNLSRLTGLSICQIIRMAVERVDKHPTIAAVINSNQHKEREVVVEV